MKRCTKRAADIQGRAGDCGLALLNGGIGVANTMLMAVVERHSEFAVLSAVGWSAPQAAGRQLIPAAH
jgi:hypothetical protein